MKIFNSNRIIFCWNVIDLGFSERVISKLLEYNRIDDKMNITTLLINSMGGNIIDVFAITDIIEQLDMKIRTIALGQVYSAAVVLLLSGTKNERYAMQHTDFLIHQYSWQSQEQTRYDELVLRRNKEDELTEKMIDFYIKHSKLKRKEIEDILKRGKDFYFNAKTALRYGIVDEIIVDKTQII